LCLPEYGAAGSGSTFLQEIDPPQPRQFEDASGEVKGNTDLLAAQLYEELQVIARRLLRTERAEHTLDTSSVVHETFLRLAKQQAADWQDRQHFLSAAARTMRRVLVDYARDRRAVKRDAGVRTTMVSMPDVNGANSDALDVLALDDVLSRLASVDARQALVVELRVFGGFDVDEIAEVLGVSARTIKRDWRFAKAWLTCELAPTN
jgi:RNA polymerase sigma factor (TIGR02999 family)